MVVDLGRADFEQQRRFLAVPERPGGHLESLLGEHPLHARECRRPLPVGADVRAIPGGRVDAPAPADEHEQEQIRRRAVVADEPVAALELGVDQVVVALQLLLGALADAAASP